MSTFAVSHSHITIPPRSTHTSTVIILHGLGDTGEGWRPIADMLSTQHPSVKWILPTAPSQPIDLFGGAAVPAWFNARTMGTNTPNEDEASILSGVASVKKIVNDEISTGTEPKRIVLGGFSQGAAISLLVGLTFDKSLGGIFALSGRLPLSAKLATEVSRETPFFIAHGTHDSKIPYSLGKAASDILINELAFPKSPLNDNGKGVVFHSYDGMAHSTSQKEIQDLSAWLKARVSSAMINQKEDL